jgi:hypothetical protein
VTRGIFEDLALRKFALFRGLTISLLFRGQGRLLLKPAIFEM